MLRGDSNHQHGSAAQIGVLLVNLGTPKAPDAQSLRVYLRQFLSDRRVVEASPWWWLPLLYGVIVPRRAPRSAAAYRSVWTAEGSPLLVISRAQQQKLAAALGGLPAAVELAMSYGNPSIADGLRTLRAQNCGRIVVLPLYPQYASSTIGSVFTDVARELSTWRLVPHLRFIAGYCDDPRYVAVLAKSIADFQSCAGRPDKLIFSFHGTPQAMLLAGDPYHCWCHKTARLTAAALGLPADAWMLTFQSRFGRAQWLQPYTDETLRALPSQGVRHLQIVCPAFAADCLETLEEIAEENRDIFHNAGGTKFEYIAALNDSSAHIDFLRALIMDNVSDWLERVQDENDAAKLRAQQDAADKLHRQMDK